MSDSSKSYFTTESSPTRADAIRNRSLLLETARRVFEEQGVDSVSMTRLAEEAGVGKGTLYRHFNNKAEVCYALLDNEQRDLQNRAFERLREVNDPYDNMRWFLGQVVDFVVRNIEMLAGGLESLNMPSLDFPAHHWWRMTMRGLLQRMDVSGDIDYLTDVLYVMVSVETIHYQLHALDYSHERICDGVVDTFARLVD